MYNFDPYNVLLAITTNIAVLLMVCAPGTHINILLHYKCFYCHFWFNAALINKNIIQKLYTFVFMSIYFDFIPKYMSKYI